MKNFYEILGVAESATDAEIKTAFRKLAMNYHPDKNPGDKQAESKFKEINEAYQQIGDSKNRAEYDQMRKFGNRSPFGFNTGGPNDWHFNLNGDSININGLDDIINQFFSHAQGFRGGPFNYQQQTRRNKDLNIAIEISLETIMNNKEIPISFEHNGRKVNLSAQLPAGIENETRMRFPGHGDNSIQGIPPGDLYAIIKIQNHKIFRREHQNLLAEIKIDAIEAITGTKATFKCLDNSVISVDIPRGTQHGTLIRVPGKGLPVQIAGRFGDLILNVAIIIPTDLDNDHIKILKKIVNRK